MSTIAEPASGSLRNRLGLPAANGSGKLLGAATIDSVGSGFVLAFLVIYFVRTTTLSLPAVGGALSLARLLAAPTAVTVGPLIDRWGARRTATAGNALSAVGYAGFLGAHQVWQIVLAAWLAQIGAVTYWTSSTGLVVLAADAEERPRWFALLHMMRNSGLGLGGALGAFLIGAGGTSGLRFVVVANAASYVVAALLLGTWRPRREGDAPRRTGAADDPAARPKEGYRTVLADRRYLLLIAINVSFVFSALVLSLLMTVFITDGLHQPAWIGGALLVGNSVQVALSQSLVTKRLERCPPALAIAGGAALNALAYLLFSVLDATPEWVVAVGLVAGIALYNLAETVATPFSEALSVSLAPEHLRGRYLAVYQLSWTFGQTVAPGLFALMLSLGPRWPWLFLAAVSLAAVPGLLRLERLIAPRSGDGGHVGLTRRRPRPRRGADGSTRPRERAGAGT